MNRSAKIAAISGGALTLGAAAWGAYLYSAIGTGLPNLDSLRWPLIKSLFKHGIATVKHGRSMMSIFHNEHSNGDPDRDISNPMQMGDTDPARFPGGPSIGPGQVYRSTATDLGLWIPTANNRSDYMAFGQDPKNFDTLVDWAVVVFKSKLAVADSEDQAIRLYNGSGPQAAAYLSKAEKFAAQVYTNTPIFDSQDDTENIV